MKTYIKQLIDSKGNNLIPVSSTSSCYNSSGFTVDQLLQDLGLDITNLENSLTQLEEDITTQISADIEDLKNRSVKLAESVTWAELQSLKNSNQLNPGQKYIVTDFKTSTTTPETSATGKTMKLILTATSKNSLDENGLALIISSVSGSGGGSGIDLENGTAKVKRLLMGDDQDEDNPGEWMIDEGTGFYFFYDMYEFGGDTYYRWIKMEPNGIPLAGSTLSGPVFILTSTDTFDFSSTTYYEPDFCIQIDQETGDSGEYEIDKVIMGEDEYDVPLVLFENEYAEGHEDAPLVMDPCEGWAYNGTLDVGGTVYYSWKKCENGEVKEDGDGVNYVLLTDTINFTFDEEPYYYEPVGIATYDGQEADYTLEEMKELKNIRFVSSNYKSALSGGGSSSVSAYEVKYCLDNDTSRFSWANNDTVTVTVTNQTVYYLVVEDEDDNQYRLVADDPVTTDTDDTYNYTWKTDIDITNNGDVIYSENQIPSIGDSLYAVNIEDGETYNPNLVVVDIVYTSEEYNKIISLDFDDSRMYNCICTYSGIVSIDGYDHYSWYSDWLIHSYSNTNARFIFYNDPPIVDDSFGYIEDYTDSESSVNDASGQSMVTDIKTLDLPETTTISSGTGTGVIYWMRDAKNNSAPYDFKNILFNNHYTFDLNGTDFSKSCDNNTIQPAYNSGVQVLNKVTFRNTDESDLCSRNFIGGDVRGVNYGPGTCGTDTRLILGEY